MMNQLLDITTGTIDWSRAQFALTAIYHWLFVPLTLGLAVIMGIMETCYYRTKKRFWKDAARFWQKLFGVNFAMGVATGIILEFEFGTNWSNYSWFVGDIFGAPLAIEGIIAFFMESTFVAVMFFGWKKVSAGFHLASTWLTGAGATISAWWILVANSWMQYPVGCEFNPDTMRNEMVSFADVALSPFAVDKFCHTVTSAWIIGAIFTVAVSAYYLLKKREQKLAIESIKIGSIVGLVAALLAAFTGDNSAYMVSKVQPMKLAAMEALYNGGQDQSLTAVAWVNPFAQSDYVNQKEAPARIGIPNGLSILATRSFHGYVPGVNNLINGYQLPDGTKELFWSFRVMVGMGCLLILFFAISLFYVYRKDIAKVNWLLVAGIVMLPLSYIASESGWIVAEMGRQPWTIQDMLPTWAAISDLQAGSIILTFFIFLVLFTTMLIVEISILCKQIKKGPEHSDNAQSTMQNS
jgi:cytochrome d ubiquinol oxidase subunit I